MSRIRGRDTKPELQLRHALHHRGFRYRLHVKSLPGKPDLVFPRRDAILFVHGCFWHQHENCPKATVPSSNVEFWQSKFQANKQRDSRNQQLLSESGWRIGLIWECCILDSLNDGVIDEVAEFLSNGIPAWAEWPTPLTA